MSKHVEDNTKSKLTTLGITGPEKSEYIKDIFGSDSAKHLAIIDSLSHEDFDSKLCNLQKTWNEREKKARGSNKYFRIFSIHNC